MTDASDMLAAALEQMDGIIAGNARGAARLALTHRPLRPLCSSDPPPPPLFPFVLLLQLCRLILTFYSKMLKSPLPPPGFSSSYRV